MKSIIDTSAAPAAVGPYSQAIRVGNLLFCSGQIPLNPETNEMVVGDIAAQTERVIENIKGVLTAANATFKDVVKATVFLADMADFAAMNTVYAKYFTEPYPARSTIQVAALPKAAKVEIEVVVELRA